MQEKKFRGVVNIHEIYIPAVAKGIKKKENNIQLREKKTIFIQ